MAMPAVFVDRDHTLMEDPGYLSDPQAVKLLPAVETALRNLREAGYKLVVVTNQSGIARGLLTVEGLQAIHNELSRQLADKGVTLDGIYYCPFHPEGTVEPYARESEDRKPRPGMLLRAAKDLDIALTASWMVGDSPRDIEAGQRAGCRTIRVRVRHDEGPELDEDVQADFTVRNLLEAAHVILRQPIGSTGVSPVAGSTGVSPVTDHGLRASRATPVEPNEKQMLQEILLRLRHGDSRPGEFSPVKVAAMVFQVFALVALAWGLGHVPGVLASNDHRIVVQAALLSAMALQLTALTMFVLSRGR